MFRILSAGREDCKFKAGRRFFPVRRVLAFGKCATQSKLSIITICPLLPW